MQVWHSAAFQINSLRISQESMQPMQPNHVQTSLTKVFSAKILCKFKVQDSESEYCVFDMQIGKQQMAGSDWYLDSTASAFSLSHGSKSNNFVKTAKISSDRLDRQGIRQGYLN